MIYSKGTSGIFSTPTTLALSFCYFEAAEARGRNCGSNREPHWQGYDANNCGCRSREYCTPLGRPRQGIRPGLLIASLSWTRSSSSESALLLLVTCPDPSLNRSHGVCKCGSRQLLPPNPTRCNTNPFFYGAERVVPTVLQRMATAGR